MTCPQALIAIYKSRTHEKQNGSHPSSGKDASRVAMLLEDI
jgi:hypothetical protein